MTALYGCIICRTPRLNQLDWDWIVTHRALTCPGAVWGTWQEGDA